MPNQQSIGAVHFRGLGYTSQTSGGAVTTAVWNEIYVPLPVRMRATPTVTVYSTSTGASGYYRNNDSAADSASLTIQDASQSAFNFETNSAINSNFFCGFQWTASADL